MSRHAAPVPPDPNKWRPWPWILLALAASVVVIVGTFLLLGGNRNAAGHLVAPSFAPTPLPTLESLPQRYASLEKWVPDTGLKYKVSAYRTETNLNGWTAGRGSVFLIVPVQVKNTGAVAIHFDEEAVSVRAAGKYHGTALESIMAFGDNLSLYADRKIAPKETANGCLGFRLPKTVVAGAELVINDTEDNEIVVPLQEETSSGSAVYRCP